MIITRVVSISQERYILKVLNDILYKHEVSDGIYRNTPLTYQTKINELNQLDELMEELVCMVEKLEKELQ